ncbi:glycosyltransferase family 2 protein [Fibrella sp. WM1]|uniref:glycosyltransferase family 2 protein n=1 Tax=Fibrella musci TaxID=3242485 RepID=UPI00352058CD
MKKVSVCLAAYNGEKHIGRQLASIVNQLGPDDEVIVSDDASTDATHQIVASFNDSRIKFYTNTGTHGPVGNFQHALSLATGDLIFLSDQDDVWLPDKLTDTVRLLDTHDLVVSDCTIVDEQLNTLHPSFFAMRGSRSGFVHNLLKNSYMGCCMAFRRDILILALPIPATVYMHDWWIGLLAELNGKVYFYKKPLILYVRHGNNASPTGEGSLDWQQKVTNRAGLLTNLIRRMAH